MTKAKYPRAIKEDAIKSFAIQPEELGGTLENWLQCRQERMQAQFRLLQSCRSEEEVQRFKAEGLLNFEGTSLE